MGYGRGARATAALGVVCVLVAGCTGVPRPGATPSPSPSPTTSGTPSPSEPVTVTLAVYGAPADVAAYQTLADTYENSHPGVTVELETTRGVEGTLSALRASAAEGDPPDVFLVEHDQLPQLVVDGLVEPVDALLGERNVNFGDGYQRDGLEAFAEDARLQCMPHDVSATVVYYNKALVDLGRIPQEEDVEPPNPEEGWTFEEFSVAARHASRGNAKGVYIAPRLSSLAPFIWSGGGEIVDDTSTPTTLTFADGDSRSALEEVLTLVRDPQLTLTTSELDRMRPINRFKSDRLGMIIGSRELTPALRNVPGLDFDVMPLPTIGRYQTISEMSGYCISSGSDDIGAAADLIAYAVSKEGATITAEPGYVVPSNLEVAFDEAFLQPGQQPESAFVFNEAVRETGTTPFVPAWPELSEAVDPVLLRMFQSPIIDLEALLEEIDSTSQRFLAPDVPPEED